MKQYLILRPGVYKEDFLQKFLDNHWLLWGENQRSDKAPYEIVWISDSQHTTIHFIDDHLIGLKYLVIKGTKVDEVTEFVLHLFPSKLYRQSDIFQMLENASMVQDRIQAIHHVGVAAPSEFDPMFYKVFEQELQSSDPAIRLAMILVLSYVDWTEVKKLVKTIAVSDLNPEVREAASNLLESYNINVTS